MEQETKQKPWTGIAAGVLVLCLILSLALSDGGARAASAGGGAGAPRSGGGAQPVSGAQVGDKVVPLGRAVGIKLFSDGVLVVGLSAVETDSGPSSPGRTCGLKAGDIITHINGQEVNTIEEVQDILGDEQGDAMTLRATRNGKPVQLSVQAIQNTQGSYQLGVWLRDSMAGIGTMTFYDPDSGVFAALGHGINDVDTATLMPMESGSIMYASVTDVKKGESGAPGELHGSFDVNRDLGDLYANTNLGIYGVLRDGALSPRGEAVEVAAREEVHVGGATILSNIAGEQVEEYQVEITHVYPQPRGIPEPDGAGHRPPASGNHWRNCPGDERQSDPSGRQAGGGGDPCPGQRSYPGIRHSGGKYGLPSVCGRSRPRSPECRRSVEKKRKIPEKLISKKYQKHLAYAV